MASSFLDKPGIAEADVGSLHTVPVESIVAGSLALFNDIPGSSPGTLAFAPMVDRDLLPDYPLAAFRAGRSHPVPLIIGTNEHEAALFKWVKSPLMPITPDAIRLTFSEIAQEQPDLKLPTEAEIGSACSGLKLKVAGLGSRTRYRVSDAHHLACRGPQCGGAGQPRTDSTGRLRCCGPCGSAPPTQTNYPMSGPILSWGARTARSSLVAEK